MSKLKESSPLRRQIHQGILHARQRVYTLADPTPLDFFSFEGVDVFAKREDLGPINAYKWRGAYNRMALMSRGELDRGVVVASAGNHAQGVALSARTLKVRAKIYMPVSTPKMKQAAVRQYGGDWIDIELVGDTFDEAYQAALDWQRESGSVFVHPYDHVDVMAGQGTLADEIVMSGEGPYDIAYLQIGGGGMSAAVAAWLKFNYPDIEIVGVEGVEQASMKAAFNYGRPVSLDYVDVFCDGTAVKQVGELTFSLAHEVIDRIEIVTNQQVCAAIQCLWEQLRCIPEPAGAMGLAALIQESERLIGKRALVVVSGANMDFGQLGLIAQNAAIGTARRHALRLTIGERAGTLLWVLENALNGLNILDFQYGKLDAKHAYPVIGFEADDMAYALACKRLEESGIAYENATRDADVLFRMIHYNAKLFRDPLFYHIEFVERAGALRQFLRVVQMQANICYFNYAYSGERVGRALLGFEFESAESRKALEKLLEREHPGIRSLKPVDLSVVTRIG